MPSGRAAAPRRSDRAAAIDVVGILRRLPHRYPFLLVDRVLEIEDGKRIVAIKNVTVNEPFFPGHFPTRPIFPGVLLTEALVQTGGLLASASEGGFASDSMVVLVGIEHARFRVPVEPGDQLRLEVTSLHRRGPLWKMRGKAMVDGGLVAEADFLNMETKAGA